MEQVRHHFLAGPGFALDEGRKGRVGVLADLTLELLQRGALADQGVGFGDSFPRDFGRAKLEGVKQDFLEILRIAGLGDEFCRAERARVPRVGSVVLARQHQDLHGRGMREQVADQLEALVGPVGHGGQAEIDQRELRSLVELPQQTHGMVARIAHHDLEILSEGVGESLGDQWIVVDDQEAGVAITETLAYALAKESDLKPSSGRWGMGGRPRSTSASCGASSSCLSRLTAWWRESLTMTSKSFPRA